MSSGSGTTTCSPIPRVAAAHDSWWASRLAPTLTSPAWGEGFKKRREGHGRCNAKTKGPRVAPRPFMTRCEGGLVVHPVHAAARHRRRGRLLLGLLGDHRLGGDEETGDRRRVLQREPHDLGPI